MQEKTLLKISLICSIIGLMALFFISKNIVINEPTIITKEKLDQIIKVKGKIININEYEKTPLLK